MVDHQERAGSGEKVTATKVKKTSSKEKLKARDTSKISTESENMHENIVEVGQEMESSLTPNDKGAHDDKFGKKELKEYIQILYTNANGLSNKMSNKIDELNTRINETFPEIIAICETKLNDDIGHEAMPKNNTIIRRTGPEEEEVEFVLWFVNT